ncbi:MAG TPA: hypothetical protein VHR55_11355 [Candidatus Limnocylindria bacterium]|nr:hypothetical protein [Candidatus Limnocylindria bacterium]
MRVIRPSALGAAERRRTMLLATGMLVTGAVSSALAVLGVGAGTGAGAAFAAVGAIGLGIGAAWLIRVLRPNRTRELTGALVERLSSAFDDSYTLVVAPRLPIRDTLRLDGILVGPGGVRVLTARSWDGRYRVRGKTWEFDAGRRGWIRCRTNPSFDVVALADGVAHWAADHGFGELPLRGTIAFPLRRSKLVLEEPSDEILTSDNAPWWANSIGRVKRLDTAVGAQLLEAILDAAEHQSASGRRAPAAPAS